MHFNIKFEEVPFSKLNYGTDLTSSTGDHYGFNNSTLQLKCSIKIPELLHLKCDRLRLKWKLPNDTAAKVRGIRYGILIEMGFLK